MPKYDYRCEECSQRFSLVYARYADFDEATPACPECGSLDLARLISAVSTPRAERDYRKMSSGEMLSVLESGDGGQVDAMFKQVGAPRPAEPGGGQASEGGGA